MATSASLDLIGRLLSVCDSREELKLLCWTGCVVLWIHYRWCEADREHRQHARDLERLAWENRRLIGFNGGKVATAT
jgi:hypothetical protein